LANFNWEFFLWCFQEKSGDKRISVILSTVMSHKFIRVYQDLDVHEVKKNLLIYGDLSGQCAQCQTMDIKLDKTICPSCQTPFNYIAFRNFKSHLAKLPRLRQERPSLVIIDFDDYKNVMGALKAADFLR
jgi:hypothetical protein